MGENKGEFEIEGFSRPSGRTVDRAPVGKRHDLRQLALRRQVAWDVLVIGCESAQFLAYRIMRIEHERTFANFMPEERKWCRKIHINIE